MPGWSSNPSEQRPPRELAIPVAAKEDYYLTAVAGTTDYVLHSPYGSTYRLSCPEAVRLQVAGVRFEARP